MNINFQGMTIEQKLMTMELLWDDLCKNEIDFSSPAWHKDVLQNREELINNGKDQFLDWDDVKKDILNSIL